MRASKIQGDHIFSRDEKHAWFIYYTLSKYHSQAAFSFREIDYVFKQMIMLVCSTVKKYRNKVSLVLSHLAGFKMDVIKWDMDAAAPYNLSISRNLPFERMYHIWTGVCCCGYECSHRWQVDDIYLRKKTHMLQHTWTLLAWDGMKLCHASSWPGYSSHFKR